MSREETWRRLNTLAGRDEAGNIVPPSGPVEIDRRPISWWHNSIAGRAASLEDALTQALGQTDFDLALWSEKDRRDLAEQIVRHLGHGNLTDAVALRDTIADAVEQFTDILSPQTARKVAGRILSIPLPASADPADEPPADAG